MVADRPKIAVIGSINMDLVLHCETLPQPGQTIAAQNLAEVCGGKGANQAVVAARAGAQVSMAGRVGDDAFGQRLVTNLQHEHVSTDFVHVEPECASGVGVVAVENSGQNSIIIVAGANGKVSVDDVTAARDLVAAADVLLLQLEIPVSSVVAAIEIARQTDTRVILDPAPAPRRWSEDLLKVDVLCPNETEAAALTGHPVDSLAAAERAARELHRRGARHVAVTLGEQGAMIFDGQSAQLVAPFQITPADTTGAGDAFAGTLSVYWAAGNSFHEAVRFANAAGALAASREGAQPGMPARNEIESLVMTSQPEPG